MRNIAYPHSDQFQALQVQFFSLHLKYSLFYACDAAKNLRQVIQHGNISYNISGHLWLYKLHKASLIASLRNKFWTKPASLYTSSSTNEENWMQNEATQDKIVFKTKLLSADIVLRTLQYNIPEPEGLMTKRFRLKIRYPLQVYWQILSKTTPSLMQAIWHATNLQTMKTWILRLPQPSTKNIITQYQSQPFVHEHCLEFVMLRIYRDVMLCESWPMLIAIRFKAQNTHEQVEE